jgi:hypothetical protein
MKEYNIPITWESYKRYKVEAENLQDAIKLALKEFFSEPDQYYLEDSFNIATDMIEEEYNEDFDLTKIYNEL